MAFARKHGEITNEQAKKAARIPQVWFHLAYLADAGYLRYDSYNTWKPGRRRKIVV